MVRKHIKLTGQAAQEITGSIDANIPPSTDFNGKTINVTDIAVALDHGALSPTSVEVKILSKSTLDIRLGTSVIDVEGTTDTGDFRTLEPGEALTLPVSTTIYVATKTGEVGTALLTYTFVN